MLGEAATAHALESSHDQHIEGVAGAEELVEGVKMSVP